MNDCPKKVNIVKIRKENEKGSSANRMLLSRLLRNFPRVMMAMVPGDAAAYICRYLSYPGR